MKNTSLTAKKFLFERYKKYYPGEKIEYFEEEMGMEQIPLRRVAILIEEYFNEKMKEVSKANIKNIQEGL